MLKHFNDYVAQIDREQKKAEEREIERWDHLRQQAQSENKVNKE